MWADVDSQSADSSRKPMNDGQITWRWSIMLRPESCRPHSPSVHRQKPKQHTHATHHRRRSLQPSLSLHKPSNIAAAQARRRRVEAKQRAGWGSGGGEFLAWGDWARQEAEVEVDPTVSFKAVSINAGVGKPTAQPKIKSFYTPFDAQMDEVDSPAPPHPPHVTACYWTHAPPPPKWHWGWTRKWSEPFFFFLIERINLFLPHGVVWGGEVRRFWWMKVREWCRDRVAIPVQGRGQCL